MKSPPALLAAMAIFLAATQVRSADRFKDDIRPILQSKCFRCHGPREQNGKVRLDQLSSDMVKNRADAETWHDALNAINLGKMPPADEPQLTKAERTKLVDWLTTEIRQAAKAMRSNGGQTVLRRLNRVEYQNTMRDLLGLDIDYVRDLPPDAVSEDGFLNNGSALRMSALQLETYLKSARSALSRAVVAGPAPEVFEHTGTEPVADKVRSNWTRRLGRTGIFVARVPKFPDEGEFVIRIRAKAEIPDGAAWPRMHVEMGFRADTQTPSKTVALIDVSNEDIREFEIRGRIEEFPLQSRTQSKYPGLLIWVRNAYSDGKKPPKPKQVKDGKKKRKKTVWEEDPDFPKVVIESVSFKAPVFEQWPPKHHANLVTSQPISRADERNVVRDSLRKFMARAWRRPVDDDDVQPLLQFFESVRETADGFEPALRETLAMVLISPDFLYRVEVSGQSDRELNDFELASRLSYFLWNSMPDETLTQLAADGSLRQTDVLREQVTRLLDDTRSQSFMKQFANQWLDLSGVDRVAINPNYYPNFNPKLKQDMRHESQAFFSEVVRNDLSALNFLRSDFAMLNEPLARHYGLKGPRGGEFERVALPDEQPGGLLSQASILLANSTGEDSHPILRGVWLRKTLLNDPPAPPPPNVPDLNREQVDASLLPLRKQLDLHRENAACAHCHERIDPWGIALEEFDALGLRRESIVRRSGKKKVEHKVEASITLPDGQRVNGATDLAEYLASSQSQAFARALTSKLLAYALGRSLELSDAVAIDDLAKRFVENKYRLRFLIAEIVTSESFRR